MSILRQDPSTKDWTIISPNRAKRPEEYKKDIKPEETDKIEKTCPFCMGNEALTPKEIFSIGNEKGWEVRVIPNKYPALEPIDLEKTSSIRRVFGSYLIMNGIGSHEIVIESPFHNDDIVKMKLSHIEQIIQAYRQRYLDLSKNKEYELIIIFRNHGEIAGSSIKHPHSQIVATPFVPNYVRNKLNEAQRYFDDFGSCVYCDMIKFESTNKKRIIYENKDFLAFAPFASTVEYNIMIIPKEHYASFIETPAIKNKSLSSILKVVLQKLYGLLGDPDYNYIFDSCPTDKSGQRNYHWHIEILPRITTRAGFEIGSGVSINTMLPEKCAKFLRDFKV
ncbi:MAG: galactose-1-phosphate uridylyltransferase [Actinobacteria bacterium]|nr:galactose-1-phosphate uridylyltransferase [Actinomycetota bacterium]